MVDYILEREKDKKSEEIRAEETRAYYVLEERNGRLYIRKVRK